MIKIATTQTEQLLNVTCRAIEALDRSGIDRMASEIAKTRMLGGRCFVIGSGGGAAHASHACCDLRKLCEVETYCPSDNVAELTARVNDDGWDTAYANWLKGSQIDESDTLLVISVGGGSVKPPVSTNLVKAAEHAKRIGATVLAIVGRDGGWVGRIADVKVLIPCDRPELVTAVTEGAQSVVLHALAAHPCLQQHPAKWEGIQK